jgi:peptide/nickel transport system permease protein
VRGIGPRKLRFRPRNLPLVLGTVLVSLLVIVALLCPILAPHDPVEIFYTAEDRDGVLRTPPFKPGELPQFPLGTDWDGRDLLSRLLWALRPTLVLATLIATTRLVVGSLLGFLEGWYGGMIGDVIASLTRVMLAIPTIIFAIIVIYILGFRLEAWVFVVALTLTGWASTTKVVSERVRLVRGEPFIEASKALGVRDGRIFWHHVLPQVTTLFSITWAFEMSAVLLVLAELGFLGFFMAGGAVRLIPDARSPAFISQLIAGMPELCQMLSTGWENFLMVPWLSLIAGTAFFLAIFSFLLLGEGLKRHFAQKAGL